VNIPRPDKQKSDNGGKSLLTQKMARKGQKVSASTRYGDLLSAKFQTNTQPFQRSPLTGKPNAAGNPRAGQKFRAGVTKDGRVVHMYQNGARIVLDKKADTTLKRS
jgi:hypothetical protein